VSAARTFRHERGDARRDQHVHVAATLLLQAPLRALVLGERDAAAARLAEVIVRLTVEVDHRAGIGEVLELLRARDLCLALHLAIAVRFVDAELVRG
jgi:hypothetical protein